METSRPLFGCLSCATTASNSIGIRLRHRTRFVSADPKESVADHPQLSVGVGAEGVLTGKASMRSQVIKKRCVTIAGRRTSVTIEDEFWKGLREIADGWDQTLYGLIADIDAKRQSSNLSSALRLFVLQHYRDELARRGGMVASLGPSNSEYEVQLGFDFDQS